MLRISYQAFLAEFLECAHSEIVGTVAADGEPYATRGWGLTVLPGNTERARLLLASNDGPALEHLVDGGRIAVTAANVHTLQSRQLKGRCIAIEPATAGDAERAERFIDAFFAAVEATDGYDPRLLQRLVPPGYVACTLTIDEMYDQTP